MAYKLDALNIIYIFEKRRRWCLMLIIKTYNYE